MTRKAREYATAIMGLLLLGIGLYLVKTIADPQGFMRALPFVCVGLGCGAFGHGVSDIISRRAVAGHPDIQKRIDVEKNDERNISISNRAKAKAFDVMIYVFGALMVSFALMGVDMVAVLLLVFSYLFVEGCAIRYRCKYDKEM